MTKRRKAPNYYCVHCDSDFYASREPLACPICQRRAVFPIDKKGRIIAEGGRRTTIYLHQRTKQMLKEAKYSGEDFEDVILRALHYLKHRGEKKPPPPSSPKELTPIQEYWMKIKEFQLEYDGKQWEIIDDYFTVEGYRKCELCGQYPCRHMWVIQNPETKQRMTIGNMCVENYVKDPNAQETFKKYRQALKC